MENSKENLEKDIKEISELMDKNIQEMNNRCAHYRGTYIHLATMIEGIINQSLAKYFCPDDIIKRDELFYSIFCSERITMAHKIEIIKYIFKTHFKDFDTKYNTDEEFNKLPKKIKKISKPNTLDSKLDEFIQTRNKFAHRTFSQDAETVIKFDGENISLDAVQLRSSELKPNNLILNIQEIERHQKNLNVILDCVTELRKLIINKNETKPESTRVENLPQTPRASPIRVEISFYLVLSGM